LQWLSAAQISSLIVSSAHIIAGLDNAKTLKRIEHKVDEVLKEWTREQKAELEEIYVMSREILSEPLTESSLNQLKAYRGKLVRLRAHWRQSIKDSLHDASDPDRV